MALDTATKRAAGLGVGMPPGVILPVPDGTIDAQDRAALAGVYLPGEAAAPDPYATAGYVGGWAASSQGVMGTTFLDDVTAVPSSARLLAGFAHAADGRRYVCLWPASDAVFYDGGIARRGDGAMCIVTSGTPRFYRGPWACTSRGEVLATEGAPDIIVNGVGLTAAGFVCMENVD